MVTDDIVRWGLHELEGSGYVANDAGTNDTASVNAVVEVTPQNNFGPAAPVLNSVNEVTQVVVGEVERAEKVEQNEKLLVPLQFSPPPIPPSPSTVNDAVIAQALHEEFQKLAAAEAAGQACAKDKEAVLVQTWVENPANETISREGSLDLTERGSSASTSASVGTSHGHVTIHCWENSKEDMDSRKGGSISNSSTVSSSQDPYSLDDDDRQMALALREEYQRLDREVGNRLTKLESLKHVPRTNQSFPTYEDASADHKRLLDRLVLYGLAEQKIKGDGNCQFRALSDQLYRNPELHKHVRKLVVKQLKANPEVYSNYVPMKYSDYLKKMAKNSEWGDHVTLQAASDHFGVRISLITSFRDTCFIEIIPEKQKLPREIYLSFWAEIHYNSIYPVGSYHYQDTSERQSKKRNLLAKIFD